MSGLFGTLNIGTRGLYAQQKSIDTTSHNISNANTEGYTRQRVELETTRATTVVGGAGQIGTGVATSAITRIRDSFVDYQIRTETSVDGQYSARQKFLGEVESVFNEPTDTGISTLIGDFFDSWNTLATSASGSNAKSIVAQQALALTDELNHTSTELQSIKTNAQDMIQATVFDINSILKQISQLNQQIKQVEVMGNTPNDLMDKRDLLLDQLSSKFGITINKKGYDGIDVTVANEAKSSGGSALKDSSGNILNLVQAFNPDKSLKFSYISSIVNSDGVEGFNGAGDYTVNYYKNGDTTNESNKVTLTVTISGTGDTDAAKYASAEAKFNQLNECRVLWATNDGTALKLSDDGTVASVSSEANLVNSDPAMKVNFENIALFKSSTGELKGYTSVQEDIDTYQQELDQFAKALAFSVNGIISQSVDGTSLEGGENYFFVNSNSASGDYLGDEKNITAANITINKDILNDPMKIKTAAKYDANGNSLTGESDGSRALAIETLRDKLMSIQDIDRNTTRKDFLSSIFEQDSSNNNIYTIKSNIDGMTLDSYFKDTIDKLGIQAQEAKRVVSNQGTALASLEESRASISGVSLDEEMANLVQFQHCYQANAKVISTVDELLDVVINGLKR